MTTSAFRPPSGGRQLTSESCPAPPKRQHRDHAAERSTCCVRMSASFEPPCHRRMLGKPQTKMCDLWPDRRPFEGARGYSAGLSTL
eukprot:14851340-Alexandrium_andersonii.AAC.1